MTPQMVKFSFTDRTGMFLIFGMFGFGITAVAVVGLQRLIDLVFNDCMLSFKILWSISAIMAIGLPFYFFNFQFKERQLTNGLRNKLLLFNLLEFMCIQCALQPCFTTADIACFSNDGQSGMELAITAWLSLPVLYFMSWVFDKKRTSYLQIKEIRELKKSEF